MHQDNKIRISRISSSDDIYTAIHSLAAYLHNQAINKPKMIRALSEKYEKNATVLIARVSEEVAGVCVFYDNDIKNKTAYLSMIVVSKAAQGRGVGSALLQAMTDQCCDSGMNRLRLEVANSNKTAIRFYLKHGFELEKEMQNSSFYYRIL